MDLRVENDSREYVKNDRHLIVHNNQHELVEADKHGHVKGKHFEAIDGDMSLDERSKTAIVMKDDRSEVGGAVSLQVGQVA